MAFSANDLPTWQTNGVAWTMAQSNGVVYAGGTFTQIRPPGTAAGSAQSRNAVNFAAFDAYTGNPTSCALSVTGGTGTTVRALAVTPDGSRLYVGGLFGAINGVNTTRIAAVRLPELHGGHDVPARNRLGNGPDNRGHELRRLFWRRLPNGRVRSPQPFRGDGPQRRAPALGAGGQRARRGR